MAQAHVQSPYTVGPPVDAAPPTYVLPTSQDYAVPGPEEANRDGWWDGQGQATQLRESPTGTPDANRLRRLPMFETREGVGIPQKFAARYRGEIGERHSVEYQDADGFQKVSEGVRKQKPRPVPSDVGETRPTMRMSPHTYVFTRPSFSQTVRRTLNGLHFSMADHRREFPIFGMLAPPVRRNTYRIEPEPYDTDIVDMPPDVASAPSARIEAVDIGPIGNAAWRL